MNWTNRSAFISRRSLAALIVMFAFVKVSAAEVWYVRPSVGDNNNSGRQWSQALATLGAAADSIRDSDTVVVAAGERSYEKAVFDSSASVWPIEPADSITMRRSARNFTLCNPKLSSSDVLLTVNGASNHLRIWQFVFEGDADGSGTLRGYLSVDVGDDTLSATGCVARDFTSDGFFIDGNGPGSVMSLTDCRSEDNDGNGFFANNAALELERCISYGNSSHGIMVQNFNETGATLRALSTRSEANGSAGFRVTTQRGNIELRGCASVNNVNAAFALQVADLASTILIDRVLAQSSGRSGIYLRDTNLAHVNIHRVTVYGADKGISNFGSDTLHVTRAIVVLCDTAALAVAGSQITLNDCLLWKNGVQTHGDVSLDNVRRLNPRFLQEAALDFRLAPDSPAHFPADSRLDYGAFPAVSSATDPWSRPGWNRTWPTEGIPAVPPLDR